MNEEIDEDDEEEEERTQTEESAINESKESRRQKISEKIVDQKIKVSLFSNLSYCEDHQS